MGSAFFSVTEEPQNDLRVTHRVVRVPAIFTRFAAGLRFFFPLHSNYHHAYTRWPSILISI